MTGQWGKTDKIFIQRFLSQPSKPMKHFSTNHYRILCHQMLLTFILNRLRRGERGV